MAQRAAQLPIRLPKIDLKPVDGPQETTLLSPHSPISPWPPEVTSGKSADIDKSSDSKSPAPALPSAKEVYGSLAVLLTYISGGVYLVWAFAPVGWLDQWGWTWYPDREWAVIVPCYLMFLVIFTYWSYTAMTAFNTPGLQSPSLITDKYARIPTRIEGQDPYYWKFAAVDAIPEAVDLPIDVVNRVLYPSRSRPNPP